MSRFNTKSICRIAILAALYVPLAVFVAIQIGNVRISFGSLPVVVSALLCGPVEAILVAGIGDIWRYCDHGSLPDSAGSARCGNWCGGDSDVEEWTPAGRSAGTLLCHLHLRSAGHDRGQYVGELAGQCALWLL